MASRFTKEQIAAFKADAANPEVHRLTGQQSGVEVIVRPATRAQYARFTSSLANLEAGKRGQALKQLLKDCLIAPDFAELDQVEERYPGTIHQLGTEIRDIAGAFEKIDREKL